MADTEQSNVDYANLIRAQTRQVDINAFKERGMKKVNVINASKINALISQAVTNIIGKMEDADVETIKDDKAKIVMDSMSEFKRLFDEQKKEKEEQAQLQAELHALRESLTQRDSSNAESSSAASQDIHDQIIELKAFIINQASKAQSEEMTRTAMLEQQQALLEEHFSELKQALGSGVGTGAAPDEAGTKKLLEEAVEKLTQSLEKKSAEGNGAQSDKLLEAFTELRQDLNKKFEELTGAIKNANTDALKSELAALRDDLAEKTVAASSANTEALQQQMAQMQELLEKGGGGGGGANIDMGALAEKLEGSLSKKLAAAGFGSEEVSSDDSLAASGVMLGAAFKDMDNIESNIDGMDARKTVDKKGAKKAKGALDALKKLKGKK